jgi:hypothetical protein
MGNLLHRSVFIVQTLSKHPALWFDLEQTILGCGNAAKIFSDMLFSHIPDRDLFSVAVHDGYAEQFLCQKNASGMMTQSSMAEIRKERLGLVEPVVDREVVFRFSAELPRAAFGVLEWVGHRLHLIGGRRVIFKAVVALDGQLSRANVENDISESPAIVFVAEGNESLEVLL